MTREVNHGSAVEAPWEHVCHALLSRAYDLLLVRPIQFLLNHANIFYSLLSNRCIWLITIIIYNFLSDSSSIKQNRD